MNMFSLRTVIDDILLIVRNNNVSESEDLSRDQIASWVASYKARLFKQQKDKAEETGGSAEDDSLQSTIGPLDLEDVIEDDSNPFSRVHKKRTKNKLPELLGDSKDCIVTIDGKYGCPIQQMDEKRKHFHRFRRYTFAEPTYYYEDRYLYVEGDDIENINSVSLTGIFVENPNATSEDEVYIPGWMIPEIKKAVMSNDLSFMLKRPSDDSNNSSLESVKPHGPQDQEK